MSGVYWIASYHKSGNTWFRLLLQSIRAGGAEVDINAIDVTTAFAQTRTMFDEWLGVEASDLTTEEILHWRADVCGNFFAATKEPFYEKIHDSRVLSDGTRLFPEQMTRGAIYLVRDPRDVAPSFARHNSTSIDEAIALMGQRGNVMTKSRSRLRSGLVLHNGSWSEHVESWLDGVPFPCCVLRYEDLRTDPVAALMRALPTLGLDVPREVVQKAAAATALEGLRAQEEQFGFRERHGGPFFGEGQVGGWRRRLSAEQVARIEADHGPVMRRLGYLQ